MHHWDLRIPYPASPPRARRGSTRRARSRDDAVEAEAAARRVVWLSGSAGRRAGLAEPAGGGRRRWGNPTYRPCAVRLARGDVTADRGPTCRRWDAQNVVWIKWRGPRQGGRPSSPGAQVGPSGSRRRGCAPWGPHVRRVRIVSGVLHLSQAIIADQEEFQDQDQLASVDVRCRKRCRIGIQLMIIFNKKKTHASRAQNAEIQTGVTMHGVRQIRVAFGVL